MFNFIGGAKKMKNKNFDRANLFVSKAEKLYYSSKNCLQKFYII